MDELFSHPLTNAASMHKNIKYMFLIAKLYLSQHGAYYGVVGFFREYYQK